MSASTPAPSRTAPSGRAVGRVSRCRAGIAGSRTEGEAVIEVETVESVNNLEALAEWVPFGRLQTAFHLYVPAAMVDVARRLCTDCNIPVAEIHTYHWIGDEMRFLPVYKARRMDARAAKAVAARQRRSRARRRRRPPKGE